MCNRIILEKIIEEVGASKTAEFCYLVSIMYDIKYNACKDKEPLNEYEYEKEWWLEAAKELNKDVIIID